MFRSPESSGPHVDAEPTEGQWRIRYHGTTGFTISHQQQSVVLDPFVTRPGLLSTVRNGFLKVECLYE